jgi:flagellar basal body P-ring formation protein FlgA
MCIGQAGTQPKDHHMLTAILPLLILSATPAGHEDIAALEARLVAALGANVGEAGGPDRPLDRRLRLVACDAPALIASAGWGVMQIACPARGWRLQVALHGRFLTAGADNATGAGGVTLPVGPPSVRRGDAVAVRVAGQGFAVTLRGTAEQDGAIGARIRVRTAPRTAPLVAIVTGEGTARIGD